MAFLGAIFDVDGVLVDSPHEPAWRDALRELMEGDWADIAGRTSWTPEAFTSEVYQRELSGKPRMSGARSALAYFGVPDLERRSQEYADRKQRKIVALIEAGAFEAFPDALRFFLAVRAAGVPTAAASSSKNAGLMLRRIRLDTFVREHELATDGITTGLTLADALDVDISGRDFEHGKPAPDIFLAAAEELRAPAARCFVVEDAPSGVAAAKAGGMAALGVARADDAELLAGERADVVVGSLDEVDLTELAAGRLHRRGA
ncbi:HAD family hydrolase [Pseudonocardia acaciae]|uniref:HAD family hydrolase n=1 Tax=Pseudonocardia acaciae TaxID=551276 RepID=UPI00048CF990|nr:HAD-IA family hydrolase [Pseudonocardia acaciae]